MHTWKLKRQDDRYEDQQVPKPHKRVKKSSLFSLALILSQKTHSTYVLDLKTLILGHQKERAHWT
jgi:hypothetical protein